MGVEIAKDRKRVQDLLRDIRALNLIDSSMMVFLDGGISDLYF